MCQKAVFDCRVFTAVYPSLESEEDNPVFKSRSKKRKSSDDTPYSPTGKSLICRQSLTFSVPAGSCDPFCSSQHSPGRTLSAPTGAAGERRSPSGLHRNGTGCSCSQALSSGTSVGTCFQLATVSITLDFTFGVWITVEKRLCL